MDFICKSEMHPFTQFGALYQLVARRTGREHVNDYLYISENIYVQTEPHIHPRCRFPYFSSNVNPVNSTYHLSNLSTLHPQYQNQLLNSLPFSTIDQFPLTHKMKNPGAGTCPLTSPDSRNPLVFYTFSLFDSLTFVNSTTVSTCTVCGKCSTIQNMKLHGTSKGLKDVDFQGVRYVSFCERFEVRGGKVANRWQGGGKVQYVLWYNPSLYFYYIF